MEWIVSSHTKARWSGVLEREKPRAAYQGAEVDAEAFHSVRAARNNFAVEDTLDNKMHVPAGLSQPDQGLGMAGNPYSVADSLEEVLTNVLEELRGKLEKWASEGALTSGCPACQWRHLEGGWREFGGRQK